MSFKADVYNVLIASPSDVNDQRDEIEKAIYEWNSLYAQNMNIVLLPRRWEKDVAPAYAYGNPQEAINEAIVYNSDLVVGVFWHRMGVPTKNHPSGTLEELDHFINNGKDVIIYFVDPTKSPTDIDYSQAAKVEEYRKKYAQLGIYKPYVGITDIKDHLYRTIQKIASNKAFQQIKEGSTNTSLDPLEKTKIQVVQKDYEDLIVLKDFLPPDGRRNIVSKIEEGQTTFDYSLSNGISDIGSMYDIFELRWSPRNTDSIYLYQASKLYELGFNKSSPYKFTGEISYVDYDFSYPNIVLMKNQTAIVKFYNGFYINIKLVDAKSKSHNDEIDSATINFLLYYDSNS